jgi:hypothetical protein
MNEVFVGQGSPPVFLVLAEGTAYRVEVEPADAIVAIRPRHSPRQRPLVMSPIEGSAADAAAMRAFLVVPRETEEYRVDVAVYADHPVRVRIIYDPRESSRWLRIAAESRGRPPAGLAARLVWVPQLRASPVFSPSGTESKLVSGAGVEACLAVVPRGGWLKGPVGGCVLSVTRLWLGDETGAFLIGASPRLLLRDGRTTVLSLAAYAAMGSSISGGNEATYYVGALGLHVSRNFGRLSAEVEPTVAYLRSTFESQVEPTADFSPRIAAGLVLSF